MPYKDSNFRKLHAYIERKAVEGACVVRNLPVAATPQEREKILQGFGQTVSLLPARKNGNLFYHEIISIKPQEGVSMERHLQALHDLAHHYLDQRAPHHPAFGRVHSEPGNIHIHLMVSANELHSKKRHRLPKQKFAAIQRECERWFNATFPELRQETIYNRTGPKKETPSLHEAQRDRRTQTLSQKKKLELTLLELLQKSGKEEDFKKLLENEKVELYRRGKTVGVVFEGKKYRLKTLGVLDKYEAAKARWIALESRRRDLSAFYQRLEVQPEREFELPPVINPPVGWK